MRRVVIKLTEREAQTLDTRVQRLLDDSDDWERLGTAIPRTIIRDARWIAVEVRRLLIAQREAADRP